MHITKIEAHVMTIQFERRPVFLRGGIELVHRWFKPWSSVHDATRRMSNDMHQRMLNCLQKSIGRNARLLLQRSVRARDNPIEFREQIICVVE